MKVLIVCLSLLSLSSGSVFNLFSKNTEEDKASSTGTRKVILVPKTVYVPVYASDDGVSAPQSLTPVSSVVGPPVYDLSSAGLYPAQPPPEVYAQYGPGMAAFAPQPDVYYPPGYGIVGPQYQYAPIDMAAIAQYGAAAAAAPVDGGAPAVVYTPTGEPDTASVPTTESTSAQSDDAPVDQ